MKNLVINQRSIMSTPPKARRWAVQPVEETTRTSRKENKETPKTAVAEAQGVEQKDFAPPKRRFLPQPVETSFKSNRPAASSLPTPDQTRVSTPQSDSPKPRRRFVPELIEETKRTKKAGDTRPATLLTDKVIVTLYDTIQVQC